MQGSERSFLRPNCRNVLHSNVREASEHPLTASGRQSSMAIKVITGEDDAGSIDVTIETVHIEVLVAVDRLKIVSSRELSKEVSELALTEVVR